MATTFYTEDPRTEQYPELCGCGHARGEHGQTATGEPCELCDCPDFIAADPELDVADEAYDRWIDDHYDYLGAAS